MQTLRLHSHSSTADLAQRFAAAHRLQIEPFLVREDAIALARALDGLAWRQVFHSGSRHVDLTRDQARQLPPEQMAAIRAEIERSAAAGFQYFYENYPIADLAEANLLDQPVLKAVYATMNAAPTLEFLRAVTGLRADFCDMQATRYGPGHFLTAHDDGVAGKNRTFAFVLGLTETWSPTFGGQLQFVDRSTGRIAESFSPRFNALSVFAVPTLHHVTQVASFAPHARSSLTGWFRTRA